MLNLTSQNHLTKNGKAARVDYSPRPERESVTSQEEATLAGSLFFDYVAFFTLN